MSWLHVSATAYHHQAKKRNIFLVHSVIVHSMHNHCSQDFNFQKLLINICCVNGIINCYNLTISFLLYSKHIVNLIFIGPCIIVIIEE